MICVSSCGALSGFFYFLVAWLHIIGRMFFVVGCPEFLTATWSHVAFDQIFAKRRKMYLGKLSTKYLQDKDAKTFDIFKCKDRMQADW